MDSRLLKIFREKIPQYRKDPELFAYEVCKFECDKWQKDVFADIAESPRVTVRSGQGVVKPVARLFCACGFFPAFRIRE